MTKRKSTTNHELDHKIAKTSEITFLVHLDDKHVPEAIEWQASDAPEPGLHEAKAVVLAIWDQQAQSTLRIDLWTKEMPVPEMSEFVYQTLLTLADSYRNATGNGEAALVLKRSSKTFIEAARKAESG